MLLPHPLTFFDRTINPRTFPPYQQRLQEVSSLPQKSRTPPYLRREKAPSQLLRLAYSVNGPVQQPKIAQVISRSLHVHFPRPGRRGEDCNQTTNKPTQQTDPLYPLVYSHSHLKSAKRPHLCLEIIYSYNENSNVSIRSRGRP